MKSILERMENGGLSSLPVRGAWIEMRFRLMVTATVGGRSPCGERGLK